jgi:hypothetical protein
LKAPGAGVSGRLNMFQRIMLRWSDLHPYNGVHVVHLGRPPAQARLAERIAGALEAQGLTGLVLDPRRRWFRYEGGAAEVALEILPGGPDPFGVVRGEIERQLNAPFPRAHRTNPFRFFAVVGSDSFHLGIAYDHFIAGGDSIALLLERIAVACTAEVSPSSRGPAPDLYPRTYRRLLACHPVAFAKGLFSLPGLFATTRRAFRPRYRLGDGGYNGFAYFRLGPVQFAALRRAGKAWGVTLNDVFLASLLLALSPLAADRREGRRRRALAVASIVNARKDFGADPRETFGQFLAAFRVAHPVPEGIGLRELAQDVHAETQRIKRQKLYLQTIAALGLSGLMWPFLSVARREGFFAKYYPAWGGVTALNVDALWDRSGPDGVESWAYFRAVSTGPVCPLVVAVTTARDTLHIGVTYRTAAFAPATVDGLMSGFIHSIDSVAEKDSCAA